MLTTPMNITLHTVFNENLLQELARAKSPCVIQLFIPLEKEQATLLNKAFVAEKNHLLVVKHHRLKGEMCNLSFLAHMPSVQRLALEDVYAVKGVEWVEALKNLRYLNINVETLCNFSFIKHLKKIETLCLSFRIRNQMFDILWLEELPHLRQLYIMGHKKNLHHLARLKRVEALVLRGASASEFSFVNEMDSLTEFGCHWGKDKDFSALAGNTKLKTVEFWHIGNLSHMDFISTLQGLEHLSLQELKNIAAMPDVSALQHLKRISLAGMKGLQDYSGLSHAPALKSFYANCMPSIPLHAIEPVLKNPSLESFAYASSSGKLNRQIQERAEEINGGLKTAKWKKFAIDFHLHK